MIKCIYKLGYGLTLHINEEHHYVVEVYDNQIGLDINGENREPIITVKAREYKYAAELFNQIDTGLMDDYV